MSYNCNSYLLMEENKNTIPYKNNKTSYRSYFTPYNPINPFYMPYHNDIPYQNNQFNKYNFYLNNNITNKANHFILNDINQSFNQCSSSKDNKIILFQSQNYFYPKNIKNNKLKRRKKNNKYNNDEKRVKKIEQIQERKSSLDTNSSDSDYKEFLFKEDNEFNDIKEKKELNIKNEEKEDFILKNNKEQKDENSDELYTISNCRRFSKRSNRSDESNCTISTLPCSDIDKKETGLETSLDHKINPKTENTVILNVKVKISKDNYAYFKLKRFDDIFITITYFCEINHLNENLIKPLIIKSLCALNTIYKTMNSNIDKKNIDILKQIKNENNL